jgi:hypothetical protein
MLPLVSGDEHSIERSSINADLSSDSMHYALRESHQEKWITVLLVMAADNCQNQTNISMLNT